MLKNKKQVFAGLAAIAVVVTISSSTAFMQNTGNSGEEEGEGGLALSVSDTDFTIEIDDEPVFAVLPVEVTVEEATEAGYTLTAYATSTDLVSTANSANIIPMVAPDEDELLALAGNTYGLSLTEPESKDSEVFTRLSANANKPTVITDRDYEATEANDAVTFYYGFYIVPGIQAGTYQSSDIKYKATANRTDLAIVTFDGNGLHFNNDETRTSNVVRYATGAVTPYTNKYSFTPNINENGVFIDPSYPNRMYPVDSNGTFVYDFPGADKVQVNVTYTESDGCPDDENDYFTFWAGNHPDYTATGNFDSAIRAFDNTNGKYVFGPYKDAKTYVDGDTVTMAYHTGPNSGSRGCHSGYGYYAILTGYDTNGDPVNLIGNMVKGGKYSLPGTEDYYHFLGWSEDKDAVEPTYKTEGDIATKLSLNPGQTLTLYAIWEQAFTISYKGNGTDSDSNMDYVEQYSTDITSESKQVDLVAPNFTKQGYGFVGWSADQNAWDHLTDNDDSNNPVIYGPNQTIAVNPSTTNDLKLYAVWAPAETTSSGEPVTLQNWQGCSDLTATTYDISTNTLSVGKNTVTALTDSRDGNVYTVARLVDGNCWMTENLRLDNSTANEATTSEFSVANTNNPSLPLKNDYAGQTLSNRLSLSTDDWCHDIDGECTDQSVINVNNTSDVDTTPKFSHNFTTTRHDYSVGNFNTNVAFYGNYYNWYSATAGRGTFSINEAEVVTGDICPAGWHLPYGGNKTNEKGGNTSGGFYYLTRLMSNGSSTSYQSFDDAKHWRSFPNNIVLSGYIVNSGTWIRGDEGDYWSTTAMYNGGAYMMGVSSGGMSPDNWYEETRGFAVRCVAY